MLRWIQYNLRGAVFRCLYARNDKLIKEISPYGYEPEKDEGAGTAYAYDRDGNISSLETKAGEKILLSFAYRYDGNGNRTAKVGTQAGAALGGITSGITVGNNALDVSCSYDIRGQLLEERRNGASVSYVYDKAGNRVRKTDAKGATLYRFNRKKQLIAAENHDGKNQFAYDRQGGIVEEKNAAGIRHFTYNSRHQQTKVEIESGNVQENRYDVENLRFELLENGKRTGFVYHNGELLHEAGGIGQDLSGQTSYHLGPGIIILCLEDFAGLSDRELRQQHTYWIFELACPECLSDSTELYPDGTFKKMVLEESKIKENAIFRVNGITQKPVIIRRDVAESILRRSMPGIKLECVETVRLSDV